jgi:hypothetical protein
VGELSFDIVGLFFGKADGLPAIELRRAFALSIPDHQAVLPLPDHEAANWDGVGTLDQLLGYSLRIAHESPPASLRRVLVANRRCPNEGKAELRTANFGEMSNMEQ